MALTIDQLEIEIVASAGKASTGIDRLATSLENLGSKLAVTGRLSTFAKNIEKISSAVNKLDTSRITALASSLSAIAGVGKINLTSSINQLKKIPEVAKEFNTVDMASFTNKLRDMASALAPLSTQLNSVQSGLGKLPTEINRVVNSTDKFTKSTKSATTHSLKFSDKLAIQIAKFRTLFGAFKSVANTFGNWFKESNSYIETLNLFNITMGDGADAAYEYAEKVQRLVGIDIAEWMNYQGTFKQLTSGFGVASDKANIMSQNLTQLSYDLASFFDKDVEVAFDKLSSAMSGQVKGLREFGIDTTVASLQEYALAKGIDKSVRSMTQAEKSILRYNYIMEKSTSIQGDMARTLVTPANALRILNAQLTQMRRALGDIISVLVTKFIPYVQAMVQIITDAAKALANFFGFELPKIDLSGLDVGGGLSDEMDDAADGANDVAGSLKKIKKQLMGFDELNILTNPESDSDSGSSVGGGGGVFDMPLTEYDFLKNLDTSKVDEVKEKLKTILGYLPVISAALASWKLTKFITDLVFANVKAETLKESLSLLGKKLTLTAGVTLAITGIVLETKGIISAIKEGLNGVNFAEILGGGGMLVGGAALIGKFFGSALLGSAIGAIVAGIPMFITGIYDAIMNGLNWLNGILIPAGASLTGAGIGAIIGMLGGPIGSGIGALIGLAVGLVTDLVILIVQNWESITAWCSEACANIGGFFVDLWNGIVSVWNTVAEWFNTWVIEPVVNFFVGLWDSISQAASDCWNAIVEFFTPAIEWFSTLFSSIFQTISDIFYNIGVIASGCWEIIKAVWSIVSEWFNKNIITPVSTFFSTMWNGIKTWAIGAWNDIKSVFSTIGTWINEKVIQPVSKFFSGLWEGFKEGAKKAWEGIKSVFSTVASFFKNIFTDAWNGIVKVFSVAGEIFVDIKDGIVSAFKWVVNGIIKGLNKVVSIPFNAINDALKFLRDLEILGLQPFSNIKTINVPQIPLLAEGGIVSQGQMFIAREAGPELVGNIGRKTAVANNDQIISGIESGVYRAMMAANSSTGGKPVTVNATFEVDGEVIGRKVIKYHNGVVMQTGASPLLV